VNLWRSSPLPLSLHFVENKGREWLTCYSVTGGARSGGGDSIGIDDGVVELVCCRPLHVVCFLCVCSYYLCDCVLNALVRRVSGAKGEWCELTAAACGTQCVCATLGSAECCCIAATTLRSGQPRPCPLAGDVTACSRRGSFGTQDK
jgi:hypothetical protein